VHIELVPDGLEITSKLAAFTSLERRRPRIAEAREPDAMLAFDPPRPPAHHGAPPPALAGTHTQRVGSLYAKLTLE